MAAPRVLILRAPGTNCDEETAFAFKQAGASVERVHVNRLIENPALKDRYQVLVCPVDSAMMTSRLTDSRHKIATAFRSCSAFVHGNGDRLVLGICNGMQVLMRLGNSDGRCW